MKLYQSEYFLKSWFIQIKFFPGVENERDLRDRPRKRWEQSKVFFKFYRILVVLHFSDDIIPEHSTKKKRSIKKSVTQFSAWCLFFIFCARPFLFSWWHSISLYIESGKAAHCLFHICGRLQCLTKLDIVCYRESRSASIIPGEIGWLASSFRFSPTFRRSDPDYYISLTATIYLNVIKCNSTVSVSFFIRNVNWRPTGEKGPAPVVLYTTSFIFIVQKEITTLTSNIRLTRNKRRE
jgi:hypothetical protein